MNELREQLREVMDDRQHHQAILNQLEHEMRPITRREWDIRNQILQTFPLRGGCVSRYTRTGQAQRHALYQELNSVQLPERVCELRKAYGEAKRIDGVLRDKINAIQWAIAHPPDPKPSPKSRRQDSLF